MRHMFITSAPEILKLKQSEMHIVLPHLYGLVPEYVETYKQLARRGDFIMQDNSLFELKHCVAGDLLEYAKIIGAHEVVVPEVLRNAEGSMQLASEFFASDAYRNRDRTLGFAAVVQGGNYKELVQHYRWISAHSAINTICIPFNYEFDAWGVCSEQGKQAGWNRFSFILRLIQDGIWDFTKPHHLLGLYNPAELAQYAQLRTFMELSGAKNEKFRNSLRSNDSSSCFWHSLYGVRYDPDCGLLYQKIETTVDFNVAYEHEVQEKLFFDNAFTLLSFVNGVGGGCITALFHLWNKLKGGKR